MILYACLTRRAYNWFRVTPRGGRPPIACLRGKEGHAMAKAKKKARPINPRLLRDLTCDRVIVGRNPQVCRTCLGSGVLINVPGKLYDCPACFGTALEWNGGLGEGDGQ